MRISDWSSDVCSSDLEFTDRRGRRIINFVRRHRWVVCTRFIDLDRVAVEVRICEQLCGSLEVHDGKILLAVLLIDARAAPDDLLELGHGPIGRASCRERVCQYG